MQVAVGSAAQAMEMQRKGARQRQKAATALNYHSSRSHSVFTVCDSFCLFVRLSSLSNGCLSGLSVGCLSVCLPACLSVCLQSMLFISFLSIGLSIGLAVLVQLRCPCVFALAHACSKPCQQQPSLAFPISRHQTAAKLFIWARLSRNYACHPTTH